MSKLTILLFAISYMLYAAPVLAQATDSAEFNQQVQQNIKKRLEKVVADKATAVKRGWVGTITDIAQTTLTLTTPSDTRQASFSATTVLIESPRKKILESSELEIGAHVIAIGFVNGNGVMDLRRLIVVTDFKAPPQREVKLIIIGETDLKLSPKTRITAGTDQRQATTKDLAPGARALLISVAGALVRIHLL